MLIKRCYNSRMNNQTIVSKWLGCGSINIFGLPFAGKDTQGRIIADIFGGVLISSGDILRHNQSNKKLQDIMAAGGIIPSNLFEEIVLPFLSRRELKDKPLILSEVGRLQGEELVVMRATEDSGHPTKAVVFLKLPDEEVWNRFEQSKTEHDRGDRADDRKEVLKTRVDKFNQKVMPVIGYYRDQGLLIEVDGTLTNNEVTTQIMDKLAVLASS